MHRLKVILSLMLVSLISLTFLTACDSEKYGKDVIKLRWITFNSSVPADVRKVVEKANQYSAEKIGVVVDLEFQPSEMINLIMASGEYYDMIFTCSWLNSYSFRLTSAAVYDISKPISH